MMKILATVGGGIRGYASAMWWSELEGALGAPLSSAADLTAGTSVGSILSCAQAASVPMAEVETMLRLWGPHVFRGAGPRLWDRLRTGKLLASRPKHDPEFLREALHHVFGSVSFGSLPVRSLVCAYDAAAAEFCAIRSWRGEWATLSVVGVLLGSSAAPGYFPAHIADKRAFIDGGVAANDPSLCAVSAALHEGAKLEEIKLIAISAGAPPVPAKPDQLQEWGLLEWAPHILTTVFDAQIQTTERLLRFLLPEENYVRIKLPVPDVGLDEATEDAFAAQAKCVKQYLSSSEGKTNFDRAIGLLRQKSA